MRSPYAGITKISSIGACLARMREAAGLNQSELALKSGISKSYLGQIESEAVTRGYASPKSPSAAVCMRLAGAIGVHPNVLLLRAGRSPIDATVINSELLVPGNPSQDVADAQIEASISNLTALRKAVSDQLDLLDASIANLENIRKK